jgi:hypothetical protein
MRPMDSATIELGDDGWQDGPEHPRDELRFALRYGEYPGGEDAYWRDFREGLITYFYHWKEYHDSDEEQPEDNEPEWADSQIYYALRRRSTTCPWWSQRPLRLRPGPSHVGL